MIKTALITAHMGGEVERKWLGHVDVAASWQVLDDPFEHMTDHYTVVPMDVSGYSGVVCG